VGITREIKTIFAIDGTQKYVESIKTINKQHSVMNAEMKASVAAYNLAGDKQGALSAKVKGLAGMIDLQTQKVNESRQAYEYANRKWGENSVTTQELKTQYLNAQAALSKLKSELIQTNEKLLLQESSLRKVGEQAEKTGQKLQNIGSSMEKVGNKLSTHVTAPLVAAAGAAAKAAMDYESAFAGVIKTVEGTPEQLAEISEGIREMSKEVPTAATGIAAVAEAAGQLGIETENVLGFTKVMIDLGEATNMTATEGASQLARFANIMQMSEKDFEKLGSSIVELGNNSATTESEIVTMALRLAGAGKQLGLTEADVMGVAAAMSSLGIESEMGGSAMSKLMIRMQLAASTGTKANEVIRKTGKSVADLEMFADKDAKGFKALAHSLGITSSQLKDMMDASKGLKGFSDVTGKTAEQFAADFKKDATGTLELFINSLGKMKTAGGDVVTVLENMDISEVRMRDAILRAAGAGDFLTKSIDMSNKAWDSNIALVTEANRRYATTESQLKMSKNQIVDAAITVGNQLLPVIADLAEDVADAAQAFGKLDPEMQKSALIALGVVAALGPVTKTLGVMTKGVGVATKAWGKYAQEVAKKKAADLAASAATSGLTSSTIGLSSIISPAALAIGAAALAATGLYLAYRKQTEAAREAGEAGATFADGMASWREDVDKAKSALDGFSMSTIVTSEQMSKWDGGISEAQGKIIKLAEKAASESRAYTTKEQEEITKLIGIINDYTQKKIDAYQQQAEVVAAMASREKEVSLQRANELIKGAEDAKEQTLAIAEAKYKDLIGLAETNYGHLGEKDKTAYDKAVTEAEKLYQAQVDAANKTHGETLSIIQKKYADYNAEDMAYVEKLAEAGNRINEAEAARTKFIEEETAKRVTAKMTEREKGMTEQAILAEADKKFRDDVKPVYEDLEEAYNKAGEANLDNWIAMVLNTELYGGKIDEKTAELVKGVLASFDELPEKSKEKAKQAMEGLYNGLEEKEPSLLRKAGSIATGIINKLKTIFDTNSPSKVTEQIAEDVGSGLEIGFEKKEKDVKDQAGSMADSSLTELSRIAGAQDYLRNQAGPALAGASSMAAISPTSTNQPSADTKAPMHMVHSGELTVRGVNDKNEFISAVNLIKQELQMEWMLSGGK